MSFTVFTFVSTQLFSSMFIILIAFLSKNNKFICKFGVYFALMPLLACLLRLVLPFETSFTAILPSSYFLAILYKLYENSLFGDMELSSLLMLIWGIGSFLFTLSLVRDIFSIRGILNKQINKNSIYVVLEKVKEKRNYDFEVHIVVSDFISTPFIFGYYYPIAYIPDIGYTNDELYYIIDHELAHWCNKDLWIKLVVQIVCIIYWWNPVIYMLRDILSHSLEIKCDSFICKDLSIEEKIDYLKTIVHTLETPPTQKVNKALITSSFVSRKSDNNAGTSIKQRFELVFDYNFGINKNRVLPVIFSILIFLLTYSVVIQPVYTPTVNEYMDEDNELIIDENTSDIIYKDKKYYLYQSGEFLFELTPNQLEELINNGLKINN